MHQQLGFGGENASTNPTAKMDVAIFRFVMHSSLKFQAYIRIEI
jgi:hypothetical protein